MPRLLARERGTKWERTVAFHLERKLLSTLNSSSCQVTPPPPGAGPDQEDGRKTRGPSWNVMVISGATASMRHCEQDALRGMECVLYEFLMRVVYPPL